MGKKVWANFFEWKKKVSHHQSKENLHQQSSISLLRASFTPTNNNYNLKKFVPMYSKPVFRPPRSMRLFGKDTFAVEPLVRLSGPNLQLPLPGCDFCRPTCLTRLIPPRSMRLFFSKDAFAVEPSADFFHISLKIINFVIINRTID